MRACAAATEVRWSRQIAMTLQYKPMLATALAVALAAGTAVAQARAAAVDSRATLALARASGCLACHAVDKPRVGPSYAAIARRFRGRADALQALQRAILDGHSGTWGIVPMPAYGGSQDILSAAQARDLARWVLSLGR